MCCVGIYICVAWVYEDMCCVIVIIRVYMCVCVYECGYICCSSRRNLPQVSSHPDFHFLCHIFFSFQQELTWPSAAHLTFLAVTLALTLLSSGSVSRRLVCVCVCICIFACACAWACACACAWACLSLECTKAHTTKKMERDSDRQEERWPEKHKTTSEKARGTIILWIYSECCHQCGHIHKYILYTDTSRHCTQIHIDTVYKYISTLYTNTFRHCIQIHIVFR